MLRLDNDLLIECGIDGLSPEHAIALLRHVFETLEARVGMRLSDRMTNEQLDEFEEFYEAEDEAGAFAWLERNMPEYKTDVTVEFDRLKGELCDHAGEILAAAHDSRRRTDAATVTRS